METRIFKTLVTMPCSFTQYRDVLQSRLTALGYDHLRWTISKGNTMKFLIININPGKVSWSDAANYPTENSWMESVNLLDFNSDLFFALAAMSAGEKFWPGEWVVNKNSSLPKEERGLVMVINEIEAGYRFLSNEEAFEAVGLAFRKATEAELIAHFIPLIEPEIVVESRDKQLPVYGRHLHVWNNGERKRQPGFYIGMTDDNRVIVSSKNPKFESEVNDGRLLCQRFDNYSDFGTPLSPSKSEIIDILADSYGLHPEQIVLP